MERQEASKAECDRTTDRVACRKAWLARFTTFGIRECNTVPPKMSWCGANPSHEQKGLTVGNLFISVLIAAVIVWAMAAETP
jgi:hypothetical protein